MDDPVYANSPCHFLRNMPEDHPWMKLYHESRIIICIGQGAWEDSLLPGAKEYIDAIPADDRVVILTSRTDEYRDSTLRFLKEKGIRYDDILFNMPMGERIVINDRKPSGLDMAYAVNLDRDRFEGPGIRREL